MYLSVPKRSLSVGVSVLVFFCSSAQVDLAPSICFKLAIQALVWLAVRALTKLGIAMAASKPMMATTIMISTKVKPELDALRIFIQWCLPFCARRGRRPRAGYIVRLFVH